MSAQHNDSLDLEEIKTCFTVGKFGAPYGVRGWLKMNTFTESVENIFDYQPWFLKKDNRWQKLRIEHAKLHGKVIVLKITDCDDRDSASNFSGFEVGALRSKLPMLNDGDFYWSDLIGLRIVNEQMLDLGFVDHLFETGANDVLVIKPTAQSIDQNERLIPYLPDQVIKRIDTVNKRMVVDWDAEF